MNRLFPAGVKLLASMRDTSNGSIGNDMISEDMLKTMPYMNERNMLYNFIDRDYNENSVFSSYPNHLSPAIMKTNLIRNQERLQYVTEIRKRFTDSIAENTSFEIKEVDRFLDSISPRIMAAPIRNLISPEIKDAINKLNAVDLLADLPDADVTWVRNFYDELRGLTKTSSFMERGGTLYIFESVRDDLMKTDLVGKEGSTRYSTAKNYFSGVLSYVEALGQVDILTRELGDDLGRLFDVNSFQGNIVSRIIQYQVGLSSDLNDLISGGTASVSDTVAVLRDLAGQMKSDIAYLYSVIPAVPVPILFEMALMARDIETGLIDVKVAVIDLCLHLPLEIVNIIINYPLEGLQAANNITENKLWEGMYLLWNELQSALQLYEGYINILELDPSILTVREFSEMSRDLITLSKEKAINNLTEVVGQKKRKN